MSTSVFTINDIKDALKENKWSSGVTWDLNEITTYEVFDYSTIASNHTNALLSASKVIDSKVLDANDTVLMNWNTALFTNSGNSNMGSIFDRSLNLTEWKSDLSSLTSGYCMFFYCSNLASFDSDLSNLTDGCCMFYQTNLTSFDSDLSSLTNGRSMFYCSALASFDSDLSSLTDATWMFGGCYSFTTFNSDLSSLTDGNSMFYCSGLESFNSDLSSLTNGNNMFYCTRLTTFNSNLSSLTSGYRMFYNCNLDTPSVQNIASTINTVSSGTIHIGIANSTPNTEEETAFNTIASKGWRVYVNGSSWTPTNPTSVTNLTEGEEQSTPIPFYAKPIQVTEDVAEYVDANNNYYNIAGALFIYGDDISTYGQFTSHDHAVEEFSLSLGLTKYVKPTEEKVQ